MAVRSHTEIINAVIDNFDFETVHKFLELGGEVWTIGDEQRIPSIDDLKDEARMLLEMVVDRFGSRMERNYFKACTTDNGNLTLNYIMSSATMYRIY